MQVDDMVNETSTEQETDTIQQPATSVDSTADVSLETDTTGNVSTVSLSSPVLWVALPIALAIIAVMLLLILRRRKARRGSVQESRKPEQEDLFLESDQESHNFQEFDSREDEEDLSLPNTENEQNEGIIHSRYRVGIAQTIGQRKNQEDSYTVSPWKSAELVSNQGLFAAVADGIGGLSEGRLASETLVQSLKREFQRLDMSMSPQKKLLEMMARGQEELLTLKQQGHNCGTTLVAVLIQNDFLSLLSVGDSRIVLYRANTLLQLNREHIKSREQDEKNAMERRTSSDSSGRALTSYLGKEDLRVVDRTLNPVQLVSGDRVLLMSDGVFGTLDDDEIIAMLEKPPEEAAPAIIQRIEHHSKTHQDNATIVVIGID